MFTPCIRVGTFTPHAFFHTTQYSRLLHTPLRSWHGGVLKLAACPRYPLRHWLLCHSLLYIHTFTHTTFM